MRRQPPGQRHPDQQFGSGADGNTHAMFLGALYRRWIKHLSKSDHCVDASDPDHHLSRHDHGPPVSGTTQIWNR
ncbi:MAG: hypothetical protein M1318_03880 [Firmicutes bacterium]|nr:hypothetical protein [Bacillota bacterium]